MYKGEVTITLAIRSKQDTHGSDAGVPILEKVDPESEIFPDEPWMSME